MKSFVLSELETQSVFSFQKRKISVLFCKEPDHTEIEEQRYGKNKDTSVDHTYICSGEYRRKFDMISSSPHLNRLLFHLSKRMLIHRSGSNYEDMYWVDPMKCVVVAEEIRGVSREEILYSENTKKIVQKKKGLLTIHSHPNMMLRFLHLKKFRQNSKLNVWRLQNMIHENDRLIIPEDIKAMSVAEIQKEKERILKNMPIQAKDEITEKLAQCPIVFKI